MPCLMGLELLMVARLEPESTMVGASIMEESEDAELTEEETWDIVQDFITMDSTLQTQPQLR